MKYFNIHRVCALIFFVLGVYVAVESLSFPATKLDPVGAGIYPRLLGLSTAALSAMLFVLSGKEDFKPGERHVQALLLFCVEILLYVCFLETVGFIPCTFAFLLLTTLYFRTQALLWCLFYSAGMTAFFWLFFRSFLGVLLPEVPIDF